MQEGSWRRGEPRPRPTRGASQATRLDCASACAPAHRGCTVQPEIFWEGCMPDGSPRDPPTRLWVGRTDVGNPSVSHIRATHPQPCGWVARAAIRHAALTEYLWLDCASAVRWCAPRMHSPRARAASGPRLGRGRGSPAPFLRSNPKSSVHKLFKNTEKEL